MDETGAPGANFNRQAFESAVSKHSPLTPEQFDKLFGGVNETNKTIAWDLMRLSAKSQFIVWQWIRDWPETAVVTRVK